MNQIVRNLENEDEGGELRPARLSDFTGQSSTLKNLSIYIRGAKRRSEPLDHILFYGPPGLGKTTLSRIISEELEVGFRSVSAPSIAKPGDLAAVLVNLSPNDVLFIDEIHRLPLIVEELLYGAMEDFKITILVGDGINSEPLEVDIPPFTLVAATTRKGMLSQPLQDRFGIQFRLEYYEASELKKIVRRAALKIGENMGDAEALEVARRSRGTPRIALRLLKRLRDFREDAEVDYSVTFVAECLDEMGITPEGLDELDLRYLAVLTEQYNGGPVGIDTMATALSESRDTLETSVEPFLIRTGKLAKTRQGRIIPEQTLL